MKNYIPFILSCLLMLFIILACNNTSKYTDILVDKPTGIKLEAMGAELDPHFFSQNLTRNDSSKESDWQYVVDRVKKMALKKFRMMVLPQWYEPENDNHDPYTTDISKFTFDSQEMQSLYRVLDLAQEQQMNVCIVVWGCPTNSSLFDPKYAHVKRNFMADPNTRGWITGPIDYEEWAENFSTLIKYLIEERKYTCVKEITPMNEPDGGPLLTSTEYIKMAKVLDAFFKKDGIREKVRFNLSDNTDTRTFYLKDCADNLSDVADIFNSHTYIFGYETPNDTIYKWEKNNVNIAAGAGKKHLVGEFGSNQCVGASRQKDIDLYARGVLMTRLVLNFFNAGAAGVSYWSLIDQYYNRDADYQQMQQLGLWKYLKEVYKGDSTYVRIKKDYEVRPQYYSYSLLTRFLRPGADIYPLPLNEDFAIGTAFKNENGKWTYVFANATDATKYLSINNSSVEEGSFDIYRYEENALPEDANMITSSENIQAKTGKLRVEIRPNSVVLCNQLNDAEIPNSWRTEWQTPSATMRPLQIIHGGVVRYNTPEKMSYFKDECGLGGIVCNVGSNNYLYNEDEWKLFVEAVQSAKSLGLRVWIYDEDGYPSPQAGGVVLRGHPELECMALVYDKERKDDPFYIRPAYEFTHASNNYAAARRYPNPLHPGVTQRFLEVTHQQYRDRLGEELFAYVEAFFTDEPSLNAMNIWQLPDDVRQRVRVDDPLDPTLKPLPMVIWCDDLPERYREKYNEDLLPARISLFEGDSEKDKRVRRQFWTLVSELNRDRYYGQIQEWCEANGSSVPTPEMKDVPLRIASSGHALCEEQTFAHVPFDGNKMDALMRLDIPGLDMLTSDPKHAIPEEWRATTFPASAAWWMGRRLVMTEVSDHSERMSDAGPVDLQSMCATAAWQIAMGATEFTLYYSIKDRGEANHKKYCDYVGRLNAILRNAKPVYDVVLHYPIVALQEEYIPMAEALALRLMSQRTKDLISDFEGSGRRLLERQISFVISDQSPETINKTGMLYVKTLADVQKISTAGMTCIIPENSWIMMGRFQRDGRDIFLLVNTGNEAYDGALRVPDKKNPRDWFTLDPATGDITPSVTTGEKNKEITVKLQPKQALIYVCEGAI